jgi:hypothetical protein
MPLVAGFTLAIFGIGHSSAQAAEVLVNGNLEESVSPLGWSLTTSITGAPGETIPSLYEHNDGANQPTVIPGELGLLMKPQAGNQGIHAGENLMTNLTLEQTATGIVGRTYTFTGHTYFGGNPAEPTEGYSGGVDLLHTGSPSDPTPEDLMDPASVPSPTETMFEVAFLNSSNVVIGSPTVLDLRTEQMNDAMWRQHTLVTPAAPSGTAKVRVRVAATDVVENFGFQNVMFDNFTLRDSVATGFERLTNPGLNTPGDPLGWTQTEGPMGADSLAFATPIIAENSNHTSGGQQGLWLRPFVNTTQFEPDIPTVFATLAQTVPGTPGAEYTFSAWTAWQKGYAGGLAGSGVQTLLKMEFLDSSGDPIPGETETVDLYVAGMRNDTDGPSDQLEPEDWQQFSTLPTTAPAGTASVRVSVEGLEMFNSFDNPQSAFFDDFSLITTAVSLAGDYNGDGKVDAADYVVWRKDPASFGGDPAGYNTWVANFGNMAGSGSGALAAVPEPSSVVLLVGIALGLIGVGRRQGR